MYVTPVCVCYLIASLFVVCVGAHLHVRLPFRAQDTGRFACSITTAMKKCGITQDDWNGIQERLSGCLNHGKSMQSSDALITANLEEEVGKINTEILSQRDVDQGGLTGVLDKYDDGKWRLAVWGKSAKGQKTSLQLGHEFDG